MCHNYKKILIHIIALIVLLHLTGCRNRNNPYQEDQTLPCKVRGACDASVKVYIRSLNKKGIKVITIGQDYLISIPASALFNNQTPQIKWASYGVLNEVATLLKQFRKVAINITSYSSKYASVQREHALTQARSRVVADYLWSQGVDSRFIFTQGLGSDKPIVRFTHGGDSSPNARVEITFRDAVA